MKKAFMGPVTPHVLASILQLHQDVTVVGDEAAFGEIREFRFFVNSWGGILLDTAPLLRLRGF